MLTAAREDADKWTRTWVTERMTIKKLYKEHCLKEPENLQMQYPFADLLDEKDQKGADNTLEKGQLIQVERDRSKEAMVEKAIDNMIKDVYMTF
jgi:hypothetical protein